MKMQKKAAGCLMLILLLTGGLPLRAYGSNVGAIPYTESVSTSETGGENQAETVPANADTVSAADIVNYLPVTEPEDAAAPDVNAPVYEPVSHVQDIFFSQETLKGIYSSKDLYFYVEDYWDTKYVYAQIQYDVSQLIEGTASSVTFAINNVPIQSYKLDYQNGNSQILYVKIPMDQVRTGYNSFTVSAYARLYDEEGCVDDYSDANWLSISDNSHISCGYESKDPEHKISYYPYPFMSSYDSTGKGLTIAVSDQAASGEVSTAMNLMADLSSETNEKNEIQVCLLSDLKNTNPTRTILISDYDNLPIEYKQSLKKVPDSTQNTTVSFIDDSSGNPMLIITSLDDESLMEAAYMLMDESRRQQESADYASVEKGSSQLAVNATKQSDMMAWNYTLEDIMGSGLTYVGPFHQEKNIYLPVSKDFTLSESGKVALKFRYSENLDFTRSLITVYWGDVPVASKRLSKENASGDELNFEMPSDVIGTTASSIKITFDLEIADLICTPRQSDMPWAYVSKESSLFLPPSSEVTLSFDQKASPFCRDGEFNDVMLVLSDTPTTTELNLLGQVVAMYGNSVKPYGTFLVKRAGQFNTDDGDYNIITAGNYGGNAFISKINDILDFKFSSDGTAFESNEQFILSREYAGKIAVMQLLKSPYSINRGMLVIAGSNDEALLNVEEYLRDSKLRDKLTKDCVVIDSDKTITSLQFIQEVKTGEGPTLTEKMVQNKKSLIFTAIATSAMFMMLVAVIIILLRMRMYRKKDE